MRIKGLHVVRSGIPVGRVARAATDDSNATGDGDVMVVRFSPFNTWYEINSYWEGRFLERTVPGAFKRTIDLNRRDDGNYSVKSFFNHGYDFNIGDKLLGTVTSLEEKSDSPEMLVDLYDVSYVNDLKPGLRAGDYGSSFMFEVIRDEWNHEPGESEHNPEGLPERSIHEVRLYEAGPVTWPASPTASAGMRSQTDQLIERMKERDEARSRATMDLLKAFRAAHRLGDAPAPDSPDQRSARHVDSDKASRDKALRLSARALASIASGSVT